MGRARRRIRISAFIDRAAGGGGGGPVPTAILRHTIRSSDVGPPYVRLGDWLPWLCWCRRRLLLAPRARRRPCRPRPAAGRRRTLVVLPTYDERETIGGSRPPARPAGAVDSWWSTTPRRTGPDDLVRAVAAEEPRVRLRERARKSGLASAYLDGFRVGLDEGYDLSSRWTPTCPTSRRSSRAAGGRERVTT